MKKFKANEQVMARWPGSTLWFGGTVVDSNDIQYLIRFEDTANSEYVVKMKDVKSMVNFRRRSKSRGRSRSRGRSAGRRKNQNRSVNSEPETEPEPESSRVLEAEPQVLQRNNVSDGVALSRASRATPEPVAFARLSRATPEPVAVAARPSRADDFFAPRTSTPSSESALVADANNKNETDGRANNVGNVAAAEEEEVVPVGIVGRLCGLTCGVGACVRSCVSAVVPSLATIKAAPGMLLLIALPIVLTEMCTKNKCTVMDVPTIPRKLQYYYDPFAIALVAGLLVSQLLLYFLPIGRLVKTHNGATVRNNGFVALLLSLAVVPGLAYLGYDVLVVYAKFRQLQATCIMLAIVIAIPMYFRAGYIPDDAKNPVGNSGIFLPDFVTGRELTPAIRSVDLKFLAFRTSLSIWIMLNELVIVKDLHENSGQYSPTLLLSCSLQILYAGDFLWFEDAYSTTYDYMNQGFGFLYLVGAFSGSFVLTVYTRLVLNHRTELEWYYLSFIAALNLIGYTILRSANSQKHAFRSNPSDPAVAHFETLPTPAGKRLLVSGWWGVMRHPNYFGDILIFTAWTLLCGFNHALPWILLAIDSLFLVGRIFETENVCKKKYGTAWDSYRERVKYRLIPKVF